MNARQLGMRSSRMWLMGVALALPFSAMAQDVPVDQGGLPGFEEVAPPAPVVIARPEASSVPPALSERSEPERSGPEGLAAAPAGGLDLPEPPRVVVEVPAPAPAAPVQAAETPAPAPAVPVQPTREASADDLLRAAIGQRLGGASLPLPPKFPARERESLAAAYADGQPLWIKNGAWSPAAESVIDRLARADEDGLDPNDYPAPLLATGAGPAEQAEAELKLSAAAYLYARDARGGRLEPNRLGGLITPKLELPGVERVLLGLAGSDDAGAALQGFNPRYPGYAALREKLAEIRAGRPIARGGPIRTGSTVLASTSTNPALPRVSPRLEGDLIANMERWRWLPSQVGTRYILVNTPEFRLRLVEEGRAIHEARVIIGRAGTPTPIFSDLMDHAIVNPSWFIPPSILKKDVLPGLARDPGYAAKRGYQVTQRRGMTSVRMPPGPRNALGYIKFMFPNDHAVYLHDTPSRGLFASASRALSHGCVRVENPFALGGKILGPGWSEGRLKGLIGYGERTIKLDERLPIHLAYFTLSVDEYGELRSFGDVYGYNGRVRRALGLGS